MLDQVLVILSQFFTLSNILVDCRHRGFHWLFESMQQLHLFYVPDVILLTGAHTE